MVIEDIIVFGSFPFLHTTIIFLCVKSYVKSVQNLVFSLMDTAMKAPIAIDCFLQIVPLCT